MNKKKLYTLASTLSLIGCQNPTIIKHHNDFTNTRTCRLNKITLKTDLQDLSIRKTYIELDQYMSDEVRAIITIIVRKPLFRLDGYQEKPQIKFILTHNPAQTEELVFQGKKISIALENDEVSIAFYLSNQQLQKIIAAPKIEYSIGTKNAPIMGELSESIKEAFAKFFKQCAT